MKRHEFQVKLAELIKEAVMEMNTSEIVGSLEIVKMFVFEIAEEETK